VTAWSSDRHATGQADRGDGAQPGTDMGPLITAEHRDKVAGYISAGRSQELRWSSTAPRGALRRVLPRTTLLDHVATDMSVYRDEIFGPVLSVVRAELRRSPVHRQRLHLCQWRGHLHPRRGRRPALPVRRRGGHGRNQRAHPRAGRLLLLRWLEKFPVRDQHMYGAEGINFYTGARCDRRWPSPKPPRSTWLSRTR